jgi:transcriptional regulator with XRE-family HTH domain
MQHTAQVVRLEASEELLHHVAANLRAARHALGWTQQALAEKADVSRRMLAAVESGDSNVSLATLDRLAHALGLPFADLVRPCAADARGAEPVLVWQGASTESRARLLVSVPARGSVELWEWSLAPGERYDAEPDRAGMRELLYVVSGTLTLERAGGREDVAEGGSATYPSDQAYAYANHGDAPVRFVRNVVG